MEGKEEVEGFSFRLYVDHHACPLVGRGGVKPSKGEEEGARK